jgi:hypothetical protein
MLLGSCVLGWGIAQAVDIPTTAELTEKYGLQVGMTIDTSNADLAKDLLPEAVFQRLKNGDYIFPIGKLDPPDLFAHIWDKQYTDGTQANIGKFDIDTNGGLIDVATGERPWPIPAGVPFPNLDPATEDPVKMGTKLMWNVAAMPGTCGEQDHENAMLISASRTGTYDRTFSPKALRQYIDFRRNETKISRPVMFQEIFFFLAPADAFGAANLTWRWTDPTKWDSVWNYSPSTRRVRRSTAANRSDSTLGTEFTQDDGTPSYNGKTEMMDWKYIGQQDVLMPFTRRWGQADDDFTARPTYQAIHSTSPAYSSVPGAFQQAYKEMTFGFQQEPQQYASWFVPDLLWIPVPVYLVEATPKDPYYNVGKQIYYFERHTGNPAWKVVYNRAGEHWRINSLIFEFPRFKDPQTGQETVCYDGVFGIFSDDKVNRGAVGADTGGNLTGNPNGGPTVHYNTGLGGDAFDLSRFLQYGK